MDQPKFIVTDVAENNIETGKKPFVAPKMEKLDIALTQSNSNDNIDSRDGNGIYNS